MLFLSCLSLSFPLFMCYFSHFVSLSLLMIPLWFPLSCSLFSSCLFRSFSSYSQFKKCVHDPLLRECGQRARNLMDHSMGFLVSRCTDKRHLRWAKILWSSCQNKSCHALLFFFIALNSISLTDRCPSLPSDVTSYGRSHQDEGGSFEEVSPPTSFDSMREHLRDEEHPTFPPASAAEQHDSLASFSSSATTKQVMDTSFILSIIAPLVTTIFTTLVTASFGPDTQMYWRNNNKKSNTSPEVTRSLIIFLSSFDDFLSVSPSFSLLTVTFSYNKRFLFFSSLAVQWWCFVSDVNTKVNDCNKNVTSWENNSGNHVNTIVPLTWLE